MPDHQGWHLHWYQNAQSPYPLVYLTTYHTTGESYQIILPMVIHAKTLPQAIHTDYNLLYVVGGYYPLEWRMMHSDKAKYMQHTAVCTGLST